jgi:heterotetrameric sarcosine oxidase gamma subunit
MSLEFLQVDSAGSALDGTTPVARSPMERLAVAAGGRIEVRDGWNVVVDYGDPEGEAVACSDGVAWVDVSHLGKLEVQASAADLTTVAAAAGAGATLELTRATRAAGAWWCPLTTTRMLVLCDAGESAAVRARLTEAAGECAGRVSITDETTVRAALTLVGPLARDVFARYCALDLRPHVTPVAGLRPGSIARQPGIVVREAENRYLFLFGWALGEYMWTVVADAAEHLGGRPAGVAVLEPLGELAAVGEHADA